MEHILYKPADNRISSWSGGTTRELCIFPKGSDYLQRDFVWRLSSASIEKEESTFSKLPDYDRTLMVLKGEVVLNYDGKRVSRLKELEQDSFDGGIKTTSFGQITDFNLMVRKGGTGTLDVIKLKPEKEIYGSEVTAAAAAACSTADTTAADSVADSQTAAEGPVSDPQTTAEGPADDSRAAAASAAAKLMTSCAFYCHEGYCVASVGEEEIMMKPGELLVLNCKKGEEASCGLMGEGTVIRAVISYDDPKRYGPEIIPPEKATFDDFKLCVYLSNVQFRFARYVIKSLKTTWFDEALSGAINRVEKIYLTTLVFIFGLTGIGIILANAGASAAVCIGGLLAWTAADCLLVSPAIYMAFMPKPIRKHIKDVDKLTPYEEEVRQRELNSNPRVERLMKKYKNSGRNLGSDD